MRHRLLTLASAAVLAALPVSADESSRPLLRFLRSPDAVSSPEVVSSYRASVDFAALEGSPRLPFPDGRVFDTETVEVERRGPGDFTWRGRVIDPARPGSEGSATLTVQGDLMAGAVFLPDGTTYQIEPDGAEHRLAEIDPGAFSCAHPLVSRETPRRPLENVPALADEPVSRIDVLVVFTRPAREKVRSHRRMRVYVQSAVDITNTAFINSGVDARLNLIATREIDYAESRSGSDDLRFLRTDRGIADLRKSVGADLVSLIVEEADDICGQAFLLTPFNNSPAAFTSSAYSVVLRRCAAGLMTFAHEIGHNLGCQHDPGNANPAFSLFPYAYGHLVNGKFRTVMSYACDGCSRIPNFSNPDIRHQGDPTGIADQRDNHRVINQTRTMVASLLDSPPCKPGPNHLCLLGGRFRAEVLWENQFDGSEGAGRSIPRTDAAGFFSFGDASNVELMVKVLDFGDSIKLFYGQLTNLNFSLFVTDTKTGAARVYSNAPQQCGAVDDAAFASARSLLAVGKAPVAASCSTTKTELCLGSRFQVAVDWSNPGNGTGGKAGVVSLSKVTGAFWFTDPGNLELMAKVIDYGDRIDFFYGTLSNLEYTVTVTDTKTGAVKTYRNPAGRFCGGQDGNAFPR
ncbi:MAG TPA: M12 family metallo-peptidase [Thermoanaerobaculia bacterium]|nr:M12 family metallo-peptidase [Thermoanaerobaculia bacterium]